jgi:hypothetical protein
MSMTTKFTSKIAILDLIKYLSSTFSIYQSLVLFILVFDNGNVKDKFSPSVISLIKLGTKITKKTNFCLYGEGMPSIHYFLF